MANIIERSKFAIHLKRLQDVLKLIPANGYVCENCFQIYAKAQIEARGTQDFRRFYCWCDFESGPYDT